MVWRDSKSKFNPVFEFEYPVKDKGPNEIVRVTSVTGHFLNYSFPETSKLWELESIDHLFSEKLLRLPTEFA